MSTPITIDVVIQEQPLTLAASITEISTERREKINRIIKIAKEANDLRKSIADEKVAKKTAENRLMEAVMLKLLESPDGISRTDILIASESDEFMPVINKFRAYLRKKNTYILKKRIISKIPYYLLDPIR